MTSRLAVNAPESAIARRGDVTGCVDHHDRGCHCRHLTLLRPLTRHQMVGSMSKVASCGDNAAQENFFSSAREERPRPTIQDHPRATTHRDRDLDRADLPPEKPATPPRTFDAHRVRDHHEHARCPGCVSTNCHLPLQTLMCSGPLGRSIHSMARWKETHWSEVRSTAAWKCQLPSRKSLGTVVL